MLFLNKNILKKKKIYNIWNKIKTHVNQQNILIFLQTKPNLFDQA